MWSVIKLNLCNLCTRGSFFSNGQIFQVIAKISVDWPQILDRATTFRKHILYGTYFYLFSITTRVTLIIHGYILQSCWLIFYFVVQRFCVFLTKAVSSLDHWYAFLEPTDHFTDRPNKKVRWNPPMYHSSHVTMQKKKMLILSSSVCIQGPEN